MKRLLLVLVLLFGFSGSANAAMCHAQWGLGFSYGDIVDTSVILKNNPNLRAQSACELKSGRATAFMGWVVSKCPPDTVVNPETGQCVQDDFCSSSAWTSLVASESNACAAQHPNHFTNLTSSCESRNNYSFTCNQGVPKGDGGSGGDGSGSGGDGSGSGGDGSGSGGDGSGSGGDGSGSGGDGSGSGGDGSGSGGDGSGSGGDGSGSGGDGSGSGGDGSGSGGDGSGSGGDGSGSGGDGSGSGGDGSGSGGDGSGSGGDGSGSGGDGSGSGGSGSGSGGGGSSSVDLSGVINRINQSNKLLGDLKNNSVNQLKKDVEHHLANKALLSQQLEAIGDGTTGITNAIGDSANGITNAIGGQTTALTDAIGQLSDKLAEPCIPTEENRFCENPHGLDSDYVRQVFGQMDTSVSGTISEGHNLIESTVQKVIDEPLTSEVEGIIGDSQIVLLEALGYDQSCTPLVLNANGTDYSIDCEVSQQIKLILSFLIGMYTLMTLVDILLDGITPLGRKPSATRYA